MKAVILAAGQSTRMFPLTVTCPKPLLPIANKPILFHTLDNLKEVIDEAIIVVGYHKEQIMSVGREYNGIRLRYVEQKEQLGTAHALGLCREYITEKFIFMAGDDSYSSGDMKKCVSFDSSVLVSTTEYPERFGVIVEERGVMKQIIEKPQEFISNKISTGFFVLEPEIFGFVDNLEKTGRGEYEFPEALLSYGLKKPVHCVLASYYFPVGYPRDLLGADIVMRKNKNEVGDGTVIEGGISNCSIGKNCKIFGKVKNSIVMDNTAISERSVVEDSVIGKNVFFDGKVLSEATDSVVKGKNAEAARFGAAIGDFVKVQNATVKAGVKIWPHQTVSGIVERDVED